MKLTKCPECSNPLDSGIAEIGGTFWGFIAFGWSYQVLKFMKSDDSKVEIKMKPGIPKLAMNCKKCGFIGIKATFDL